VRVGIQADQAVRLESFPHQTKRFALATTHIQQHAALWRGFAGQSLEIVDRHTQHMVLPGVAAQKVETDAGFLDVGGAGVIHAMPVG
jgi:hypothetical protein